MKLFYRLISFIFMVMLFVLSLLILACGSEWRERAKPVVRDMDFD